MKKSYVAPGVAVLGSIHSVTGMIGSSVRNDFAWGPSGEFAGADLGSANTCTGPSNCPAGEN